MKSDSTKGEDYFQSPGAAVQKKVMVLTIQGEHVADLGAAVKQKVTVD